MHAPHVQACNIRDRCIQPCAQSGCTTAPRPRQCALLERNPHHITTHWIGRGAHNRPASVRGCAHRGLCARSARARRAASATLMRRCMGAIPPPARPGGTLSALRPLWPLRSPASLASPLSSVSSAPAPLHAPPGGTDSRSVRRRVAFAVRGGSAVFAESLMTSSLGRRTRRTPTRRRGQGTRAGTRAGTRPRTTTQRRGRGRGGGEEETTAKEAEAPWEPRGCWPFGVWAGAAATSPSLRKRRRAVQGEDNAADMGGG